MYKNINIIKVVRFVRHIPNFAKLVYRLFRDSRVSFYSKIYIWLALFYFVFPFDLFSELIFPFVGYTEDFVVCCMLFRAFVKSCPDEIVWEHVREIETE